VKIELKVTNWVTPSRVKI